MKRICTIGGWTGQANILNALTHLPDIHLTGIVCTTDNGWSSALVRRSLDIPSPGDIRNCITHVADPDHLLIKLMNYRFAEWDLAWTQLGNLIVGALSKIEWTYAQALATIQQAVEMQQTLLPVSDHPTQICAQLEDGEHVIGERQIIKRENRSTIQRYYLQDEVHALPEVLEAIQQADLILICPGVLWTAIVSTLLHGWVSQALQASSWKLMYMCNIMTYPSQTDDFKVSDHINLLEQYTWRQLDYVMVNDTPPHQFILDKYKQNDSYYVPLDKENISSATKIIIWTFVIDVDASNAARYTRHSNTQQHVGDHLIQADKQAVAESIQQIIDQL